MKAIYGLLDEREVKIDICHKLVAMIAEEDDENVQVREQTFCVELPGTYTAPSRNWLLEHCARSG